MPSPIIDFDRRIFLLPALLSAQVFPAEVGPSDVTATILVENDQAPDGWCPLYRQVWANSDLIAQRINPLTSWHFSKAIEITVCMDLNPKESAIQNYVARTMHPISLSP